MPLKIKNLILVPGKVNGTAVASTICEPSLCCFGKNILFTGNWFTFKSTDKGKSWQFLDPEKILKPPGVEFDCDQSVIYDPSRKLTFWILQYNNDANGENVLRVAINNDPALKDSSWYWWDFRPSFNKAWRKQWFDFNHVALSDNFLYVGSNMYDKNDEWKRGMIFRMPLTKLADRAGNISYDYFSTSRYGSLRCTLGAKRTMYFGTLHSEDKLKLFAWPENSKKVKEHLIRVTPYSFSSSYTALCPGNKNWLERCDDRVTAAWIHQNTMGFMWTADKEENRPFPFIRCVRINTKNNKVIDDQDIWSDKFAYAWPDVCPNDLGKVGITLFRGGGQEFPDHLIGVFNDKQKKWDIALAMNGTHAPRDSKWGDYLTCRKYYPGGKTWVAAGFVLKDGGARKNIQPFIVHFSA